MSLDAYTQLYYEDWMCECQYWACYMPLGKCVSFILLIYIHLIRIMERRQHCYRLFMLLKQNRCYRRKAPEARRSPTFEKSTIIYKLTLKIGYYKFQWISVWIVLKCVLGQLVRLSINKPSEWMFTFIYNIFCCAVANGFAPVVVISYITTVLLLSGGSWIHEPKPVGSMKMKQFIGISFILLLICF